ncbi:MAG: acyl-CoA dehydrogenase domain-containing protein, partial [Paracoccaceae bacterium]
DVIEASRLGISDFMKTYLGVVVDPMNGSYRCEHAEFGAGVDLGEGYYAIRTHGVSSLPAWEIREKASGAAIGHLTEDSLKLDRIDDDSLDAVLANLPGRALPGIVRVLCRPGAGGRGPDDRLTAACADLIYAPTEDRDRIVGGRVEDCARDGIDALDRAHRLVDETEPLRRKLREADRSAEQALAEGMLSEAECDRLAEAERAVREVVRVDDFSTEELGRYYRRAGTAGPNRKETAT